MGTATFTGFTSEFFKRRTLQQIEFGRDMLTADAWNIKAGLPCWIFRVDPMASCICWRAGALRYIFRNIKRYDTPFTTQNIKALYTLGIIIIAGLYMYRTVLPLSAGRWDSEQVILPFLIFTPFLQELHFSAWLYFRLRVCASEGIRRDTVNMPDRTGMR